MVFTLKANYNDCIVLKENLLPLFLAFGFGFATAVPASNTTDF
jgi:hypothetical protein